MIRQNDGNGQNKKKLATIKWKLKAFQGLLLLLLLNVSVPQTNEPVSQPAKMN